jgi:hypothetical protein
MHVRVERERANARLCDLRLRFLRRFKDTLPVGQGCAPAVGSVKGPSRGRGATGETGRKRTAAIAHHAGDSLANVIPNHERASIRSG